MNSGVDSKTMLMLHFDGDQGSQTIVDSSPNEWSAITVTGNAAIDRTNAKFGVGCLDFGTGTTSGVARFNRAEFNFSTGTLWTVDCQIRLLHNDDANVLTIFSQSSGNCRDKAYFVITRGAGEQGILNYAVTTHNVVTNTATSIISLSTGKILRKFQYQHVAVQCSGTEYSLWVEGVKITATNTNFAPAPTYEYQMNIGCLGTATHSYEGQLDEFRVTIGKTRYTGTSFTPPTSPYSVERQAWGVATEFLDSASSEFINLQSGNACPYWCIEAVISGVTSVLGTPFTATNYLIDGGLIDREKPIFAGDRSNIVSADVTLRLDNCTQKFSPQVTGSLFFNNEYLDSVVNIWAGFVNVSGTALLIQRASMLLDSLKLDSRESVADIRLRDKFKKTLDKTIGIAPSGTEVPFVISGSVHADGALQSLFITGASLAAGDLSLETGWASFVDMSFDQQTVAEAAAAVAEASDGYLYSSRKGILTFETNTPVFGTAKAPDLIMRESNWAANLYWEQDMNDRVQKVVIEFQSGVSATVISEATGSTGKTVNISNDSIQSTADAIAIASRFRDRFSGQIARLEIESLWCPSLEIGNLIAVHSTSLGLISAAFEIYKMEEEITNGTMRLYCVNAERITGKWAFVSYETGSAAVGEHSAVFAGSGATESGGWQAGWGFAANENTGFDDDGDNDNAIDTGVAVSGAGSTGIEIPFQAY